MNTQTKQPLGTSAETRVPIRQTPWLSVAREKLAERWAVDTGHVPGSTRRGTAHQIMQACDQVEGHLSLPCSLGLRAFEIGLFLLSPSFDRSPELFLKLYLMLLGEFNSLLRDSAKFMKVELGKEPRLVAQWTNCWAKHALSILVQHHPAFLFADDLGPEWARYQEDRKCVVCVGPSGERQRPQIIDLEWMSQHSHCPDLALANSDSPPVVVIPPLADFLKETIRYFDSFRDAVLTDPCAVVQQFEKKSHVHWLATIEPKLGNKPVSTT